MTTTTHSHKHWTNEGGHVRGLTQKSLELPLGGVGPA